MDEDNNINRIEKPEMIARILTRHFKARGRFCLSTIGGDCRAETRIIDNDPFAEYMLLEALPISLSATIENEDVIEIRGAIDSLYSWFRTEELSAITENGERYYELPYPEVLYQLQRRNAFRISLPSRLTATITCEVQDRATGEERPFRALLENLSATGAAMSTSGKIAPLIQEGTKLYGAQIRIPDVLDVTVDAEVRNRRPGRTDSELIIGLAFLCVSARDAQLITRAVMDIQRRTLIDMDD